MILIVQIDYRGFEAKEKLYAWDQNCLQTSVYAWPGRGTCSDNTITKLEPGKRFEFKFGYCTADFSLIDLTMSWMSK